PRAETAGQPTGKGRSAGQASTAVAAGAAARQAPAPKTGTSSAPPTESAATREKIFLPDEASEKLAAALVGPTKGDDEDDEAAEERPGADVPGRKLSRGNTLLIVGAVAAVLLAIWLTPRRDDSVQDKVEQGVAAQKAGRTDEAERLYRDVLGSDPGNKLANFNLGVAAQREGRLEEAESLYRKSLETDPDFLPALFNLAILEETVGRNEDAEGTYRRIIEKYPDSGPAHLNLGFLLVQKLNRPDEGRAEFARAVELDPALAARIPPEMRPAVPPPPAPPAP
ncbi:MAG TPA: tetratricopeptide repeat protein, partial [Actinomycetota bacterium]|nr:tetratricopeptide repeat protein [Actinomycetota bacterium]